MIKDYDVDIQYQLGKTNVVVDALNRKIYHSLNAMQKCQTQLQREMQQLNLGIVEPGSVAALEMQPTFAEQVRFAQKEDEKFCNSRGIVRETIQHN